MAGMRPKVHTEKHYVQFSLSAVASGAIQTNQLIDAVAAPTASDEIREGATVTAIYLEFWITSDDTAHGSSIVTLEKVPGVGSPMTAAQSAALNSYNNKKNIFYVHMGLTPSNVEYPMASIKGWFKIPKGKQRFGLRDRLQLNIHGQSNGLAVCGFCIYKEQY